METEYLGNAYTTQSSNDGCVAVACPIDAGCAINACGTAACGANACPADICVTAGCVANVCINACTVDGLKKERISQFFLIHSREIHFFFPMKHSIPSRKMIFRLWIAAAANCFLVLALSLKTLLMNYDIFHILTIETNIFQKCFPQLLS